MNLNFSAIKASKNLLAFSAGIDSSALFFLLLKQNIPFDIAIVNYNVRVQSKDEVNYAKDLALKYNKQIYIKDIKLESTSNFEKTARDIRYKFFEEIIDENSYEVLITAHQLNDKLEWFLMQLTKGAGLVELIGFNEFEQKENYKVYKPLLEITKEELESFLKQENIKYFIDNSNFDEKYKRNYFRHNFSDKLLSEYTNGIKKSFKYLQDDINSLNIEITPIKNFNELEIYQNQKDNNLNIRIIDNSLKKRGFLLSSGQREEILKQKEITISHKINISIKEDLIWICPNVSSIMDKKFKETCRINKIPKNVRNYIYYKKIDIKELVF
ncbi:tRNA lysidine(34) synthetase TilS [Aliarcobacter butzleri]|uniref:tRNA(Ile)-lysidine synthase n=1 Tax=Aliarcobacter butzleri L351 TaxID=1447259 RepID=A0A837J2P4_9BACT|nr:tRNA lysidine(34) synthetase TilS [Aliarcobacter butzleri]KLD99490.1 tRNA(Ile)-lysidine synthetase [Aliarcobacter butzleri L351]KLE12411.1 tRNA(Ile)-lysidine synthetase [Aliarcobacter butzleri L350]MDN5046422.1 tRNA lysidine(34) synthetase TilS [Aliarcobacter butzleri]MDN5058274.1 tRNA lysidine(34) synthetase TilS [Aliarcobacter butzleri]MDN5108543.1 tRNA lysidine(34) synthetase TilS [Aliarcobacter butzleri]